MSDKINKLQWCASDQNILAEQAQPMNATAVFPCTPCAQSPLRFSPLTICGTSMHRFIYRTNMEKDYRSYEAMQTSTLFIHKFQTFHLSLTDTMGGS